MKKRILSLLVIAAMLVSLCACGETAAEAGGIYSGGSPWIASVIEENAIAAPDVSLKDDFYLALEREWIKAHPIREGNTNESFLNLFPEELDARLCGIMTDTSGPDSHEAELVQTMYAAFLDWDARDSAGMEPLLPYLEDIENLATAEDVLEYFCTDRIPLADIFPWFVYSSPTDASRNVMYPCAIGIFLNDPADYKNLDDMDEYTLFTYDCYKELCVTILKKCGYSKEDAERIYEGSIKLEKIAMQYCYTLEETYLVETSAMLKQQIYSAEGLDSFGSFATVKRVMANAGFPEVSEYILYEKLDYFENFDRIICDENIELIRDYLLAHSAVNAAKMLDKESFYAAMDAENSINGVTGYKDETKYAVDVVSGALGWPLSKLYCEKYVTEEDRQNLRALIEDIVNEYKVMLQEEDFLSEETKASAIRKLDNLEIKCLYPDKWYDYSNLEFSGGYFDILMQASKFENNRSAEGINDPIDRTEFDMTPITTNASYDPGTNGISILPGFIGDVLYRSDMPIEEVYAKIGMVVAHEISHAFDPNGANYDEVGSYKSWWKAEDMVAFENFRQKMVDYYDSIIVWEGLSCNGELCKGEACADMGAMKVLLRLAKKQGNFDYDLFFRSFAELWASNWSPNYVQYRVMYDEHPLPYLRVNVVLAQFDEFYETYGIKEGDGMYIAPEDRVKIWQNPAGVYNPN